MKLYYSPGSCALGIHVLLEDIGAKFELARVNFAAREHFSEAFLAINPKSKMPTLVRDDGSSLTEYQAISWFVALSHPEKKLIPSDIEGQTRLLEALEYIVGTIHAQGFTRFFRPMYFTPHESDHEAVKARGLEIADAGLALIDKTLAGKEWISGDFSIADPALFYVCYWAVARIKRTLPANVQRHYERMMARASVRKALADEGL